MKKLLAGLILLSGCARTVVTPPEVPLTANVIAQGQDYYAIQSRYWNLPATIRYSAGNQAAGNLDTTFGTSLSPVSSLVSAVNPALYRVHIINTVCVRNNNCGPYEIGHGYTKASFNAAVRANKASIIRPFKERVKLYCDLFSHYPNTKLLISPALEHDLSTQAWRVLADSTLGVCGGVQLVNSPDGGVAVERYKGAWIERHGSSPQSDADVVSLDGADATQIDIGAFLARTLRLPNIKIIELWTAGYNCRVGTWQDPRVRKNCSSSKTLELMNHLYEPMPVAPAFKGTQCRKILPFKAPSIWKPLAESQVKPDPRQELPVSITNRFAKGNLHVLANNGSEVGALGYYGNYLNQGLRYYSGFRGGGRTSGYAMQSSAENNSGSGYVWLQQGGTCQGPLYPGRRQGNMRDK